MNKSYFFFLYKKKIEFYLTYSTFQNYKTLASNLCEEAQIHTVQCVVTASIKSVLNNEDYLYVTANNHHAHPI